MTNQKNDQALPGMRVFVTLWAGQTASLLGSRITGFALALWIFTQTGRATDLAIVSLAFGVSSILINLVAGPLVDRYSRKRIILLTDGGAALITIGYTLLFFSGSLEIWHIYIGAFLRGGLDLLQRLAYSASVSMLVDESHYVRTSAMERFTWYAGNIVGPGLGAALYGPLGIGGILAIDVATFLIAFATVAVNHIPQPIVDEEHDKALEHDPRPRWRRSYDELTFGIRRAWSLPGLRALLIFVIIFELFDAPPNALGSAMVLALTENSEFALAAVGIGSGIGGVSAALLMTIIGGDRTRRVAIIFAGMLGAGVSKILFGFSVSPWAWALFAGTASANFPIFESANQAYWLKHTDPAEQGRIFAARAILTRLGFFIMYGLSALVADHLLEPLMISGSQLARWLGVAFGNQVGSGFAIGYTIGGLGMALSGVAGLLWMWRTQPEQTFFSASDPMSQINRDS